MRRTIATGALVAIAASVFATAGAGPALAAPVICETFGSTSIQSGRYIVQNNVWGASTPQCIDVNQNGGFTVTSAGHNNATNGAPAAYPSIYAGCHWGNCSTGSSLPMQASSSQFNSIQTSVSMTYPSSGTWNASYDIWLDPTPRTNGQNTGAEIMVWLNRQGSIQPIGSRVGTANLLGATWDVWFGNVGWNVVSYVRTTPTTSLSFAVNTFLTDAISRGHAQRSWYLTSVQAGFEPWIGGAGLAVNSFTYTIGGGGGGGDTTPPTTPGTPSASNVTSTGATLTWAASTDTGGSGLAGYNVHREQGTTDPLLGQSTTNSITLTGLTANTQYQVYVRARDGAGNLSANSALVTFTTQSGGGGGTGSCQVTLTDQPWNETPTSGGFTWNFTVRNAGTATLSGWTLRVTFPANHQFTSGWSATWTPSGQQVTGTPQTSTLAPGASTSLGFNGRWSGTYQRPTGISCG